MCSTLTQRSPVTGGHGEDRKGIIRGKLNRGRKGKEEGHNPSMVKFCIHLTTLK